MSKILAIDSSTEACSVALLDGDVVYQRYQLAPRKHAELLLPMVDEVLKESSLSLTELDAIACCVGPGAFTGLRIAVSVAQGLAFASNIPCIAISSLQTLAVKAFKQTEANLCLSAIDARMQEVYFAVFKRTSGSEAKIIGEQLVLKPSEINLKNGTINSVLNFEEGREVDEESSSVMTLIGNGWQEYEFHSSINRQKALLIEDQFPSAEYMLKTAETLLKEGKTLKPEDLQPIYIRNNVAKKKLSKK